MAASKTKMANTLIHRLGGNQGEGPMIADD
ncbi:hypothetical protein BH10CHL1_BH10CHL1_04970 [soil metagenome]